MTFLLDVNVLIALIDPLHVHHLIANTWFEATASSAWATCPIAENGVIRIVGGSRYPNSPGRPGPILTSLTELCSLPGHRFWPDDLSLLSTAKIDRTKLVSSSQVTDTYLLALAVAHGGVLATLDRRLSPDAVHGGAAALHVIG